MGFGLDGVGESRGIKCLLTYLPACPWRKEFREDESNPPQKNKDKHAKHILGVFWMGERDRIGGIRSCFSRSLFSKPESSFVLLGGCMYFLALHGWLGSGGHGRGWWVVKKEFEI